MSYEECMALHNYLVSMGKVVRVNTDGTNWRVEYACRFSGKWKEIK